MNDFTVRRKDADDISVVYLKGYLDAHTAQDFEDALQELVDQDRVKIVVNLSELDYISSAGLRTFARNRVTLKSLKPVIKCTACLICWDFLFCMRYSTKKLRLLRNTDYRSEPSFPTNRHEEVQRNGKAYQKLSVENTQSDR